MTLTDWIGFAGVAILLMAYVLNLTSRIERNGAAYMMLNLIGAVLACLASVLLKYVPFIILEAVWALTSLSSLFVLFMKNSSKSS